ncbi:MAG TPA: hypothetical protein VFD30_12200 [Terriglobia bacterium]|jgi:hypothetical protein|nr:hypothetical protein [Terriglobia bacterium]
MYIQFVGFNIAGSSRIYSFHVIDAPQEAREFTVQVHSDAFLPARLKLQDGPAICFARLEQALQGETRESPVAAHLSIRERDIREYLDRNCPRKQLTKKKEDGTGPLAVGSSDLWQRGRSLTN